MSKKKIISFSLFGDAPMYWQGAILNIELCKRYYPDWICRFYIDRDSNEGLIDSIKGDNVEKILIDNKNRGRYYLTLCRYFPCEDKDVDKVDETVEADTAADEKTDEKTDETME